MHRPQSTTRNLRNHLPHIDPLAIGLWALALVLGCWILVLLVEPAPRPGESPLLRLLPLAVLGAAIPGGILVLVWTLAARYVRDLYGAESLGQARGFLIRAVFRGFAFQPDVHLRDGQIASPTDPVLQQAGGPARLNVPGDWAALLERAGRFTRVVGSGSWDLDPWERVYGTVDLRPQQGPYYVEAMSKEGIPFTCRADVGFELAKPKGAATATDDAVFQAATCAWMREAQRPHDSRVMTWVDRFLINETEEAVRSILAHYPLDQLIGQPTLGGALPYPGQPAGPQVQPAQVLIQKTLEAAMGQSARGLGVRILQVTLGHLEAPENVSQEWIENAKAEHRARRRRAEGEAEAARILKEGVGAVMTDYLARVGEMLFGPAQPAPVSSLAVLSSLVKALLELASGPHIGPYIPAQTLATLNQLDDTIARL